MPFIKPADISEDGVNYENEGLSRKGLEQGRLIEKNSILMVCIGGSIGKANVINRDCSCNQQINTISLYGEVSHLLIYYFLRSPYFQDEVVSRAPKATLPILIKGKWEQIPIPLPPLNEQKRIVARVEQLMAICNDLEAKLVAGQDKSGKLLEAAVADLLAA